MDNKDLHFYYCDPKKNTKCGKTECYIYGGECYSTTHKEFSKETNKEMEVEVIESNEVDKYNGNVYGFILPPCSATKVLAFKKIEGVRQEGKCPICGAKIYSEVNGFWFGHDDTEDK